jgi:hypothetical protein
MGSDRSQTGEYWLVSKYTAQLTKTVWSMPGGAPFGDGGGYQVVGDEGFVRPSKPAAPANAVQAPPGAYQDV